MKIISSFRGQELIREFASSSVLIGRPAKGALPDLDLADDLKVSRPHARIWQADGEYWVEDLGSMRGTQVNGEDIRPAGTARRVLPQDVIVVGETTLRLAPGSSDASPTNAE